MTGLMNADELIFDDVALDSYAAFVVKYSLP
jgi:hypothetical protein